MWKHLVHIPPTAPLQTVGTMTLEDDNGNPGEVRFFFSRAFTDNDKGILRSITLYALQYFLIDKSSTRLANIWRNRNRIEVKFRIDSNPKFACMNRTCDYLSIKKGARKDVITWTIPIGDAADAMIVLSKLAHATLLHLRGVLKFRGWASQNGRRVYRYRGLNHFQESNEEPWFDHGFNMDFFHAVPGFFNAVEEGAE